MTFLLRLIVATFLLPAAIASSSSSSSSLRRSLEGDNNSQHDSIILDSTWLVDETETSETSETEITVASVIAESKALYESLKEDYIKEGCLESFGEYPSATTATTTTGTTTNTIKNSGDMNNGMPCKCASIHGQASFSLIVEQDEIDFAEHASGGGAVVAASAVSREQNNNRLPIAATTSTTTTTTKLDSMIMARTANQRTKCSGGNAAGYPCKDVDLIAHLPLRSFSATEANDVWGWTSSDDREFVIWGVRNGHIFIEVTDFVPVTLGFLPMVGGTIWHDVKVKGNFAYMGSEADNHGLQIFDMRTLLGIDPEKDCVDAKICMDLSASANTFRGENGKSGFRIGTSHNIVSNEDTNFIYIVGDRSACNGGLHIVDVSNPNNPQTVACFGGDGYIHDAQCVVYQGPDQRFNNREICFCYNEDTVTIVDVTNKSSMKILSKTSYRSQQYTHQGWLSSDQSHIVFGDELDEYRSLTPKTRTLVLNVEDLENPTNFREYTGRTAAIDHNQYITKATAKGQDYDPKYENTDLIYQSNYNAGLQILEVIDYEDSENKNFEEVGYFDTEPSTDRNSPSGAWSIFPYFGSGLVAISDTSHGLFLVKPTLAKSLVDPPVDPPTENPPVNACKNKRLWFQNKKKQNCKWVGRLKHNIKTSKGKRARRKFCRKKKWRGKEITTYCPKACLVNGC